MKIQAKINALRYKIFLELNLVQVYLKPPKHINITVILANVILDNETDRRILLGFVLSIDNVLHDY